MADWSKPSVGDQYANFLKYLNAKLTDVATQFASAPTNPIDQSIRWNPTTTQWEQYSAGSSTWAQLCVGGVTFPSVTLGANPVNAMQAATKQYVDALNTTIATAQTTANNAMPKTGGTFTNAIGINTNALGVAPSFLLDGPKATTRGVYGYTNGSIRWVWGVDGSTESGSNNGSIWFINRYSDTGAYLGNALYISRATGQTVFGTRPSFNGAIPWDNSNLPNPLSASNSSVNNTDMTISQNQNTGGDLGRLVMVNNVTGLASRWRLNGTTVALELINSAYNAVNAQFFDNGNVWHRGSITGVGDVHINGSLWLTANWQLDTNGAQRAVWALADLCYLKGGGGSGNYAAGFQRNDGAWMGICHGNGDFYTGTMGWITGVINGKANANVFHHGVTVGNCGNDSVGASASGNTLNISLSANNCNCNCVSNCSCFPAGSMVLMADGTEKAIEDVRIGDLVAGPHGAAEVKKLDRPILGHRKLLEMGDGSLRWSDEHLLWARDRETGREWWHASNKDRWLFEMNTGHVRGVQDPDRILQGLADFAHLDGFKSNAVQQVANASEWTQLYLPVTDGSPIIVNGYMVGARVNEYDFDYELIDWELDRHYLSEMKRNARTAQQ